MADFANHNVRNERCQSSKQAQGTKNHKSTKTGRLQFPSLHITFYRNMNVECEEGKYGRYSRPQRSTQIVELHCKSNASRDSNRNSYNCKHNLQCHSIFLEKSPHTHLDFRISRQFCLFFLSVRTKWFPVLSLRSQTMIITRPRMGPSLGFVTDVFFSVVEVWKPLWSVLGCTI